MASVSSDRELYSSSSSSSSVDSGYATEDNDDFPDTNNRRSHVHSYLDELLNESSINNQDSNGDYINRNKSHSRDYTNRSKSYSSSHEYHVDLPLSQEEFTLSRSDEPFDGIDDDDDKFTMNEEYIDAEVKAIETYLTHHHEMRESNDGNHDNIFACDLVKLEDHKLYYHTNFANPIAMRQTFLYCIQTDDVDLTNNILRDVGIEYLLRHCMMYSGLFRENIEYMDRLSSPANKKHDSNSATAGMATETDVNRNTNDLKSKTNYKSANIFWLAALYGSARVLDLILQATWVHFAETKIEKELLFRKQEQDIDYNSIEEMAKRELTNVLNESASSYGITPLFIAAAMNHKDSIAILLKYGIDPNKPNNDRGTTPAIIAAAMNNVDALEGLAESDVTDFNQMNERKVTPLLAACRSGCLESVRYLTNLNHRGMMSGGRDVPVVNCRCQNSLGYGCASIAAQHGQTEVVIYLSQIHDPENGGIDINQQNDDKDGDSAIHVAVRFNRLPVVKALIEMIPLTCNVLATNKMGMNALHIASNQSYSPIVSELMRCLPLDTIAAYDVEDRFGMTPIFYACLRGNLDIVNVLASLSDIHKLRRVQMIKKKRKSRGSKDGNVDDNPKSDKKTFSYQAPLHVATCYGYANIIYTLLHCGAKVNQIDSGGHTALSLAAKMGNFEIVKILVENGADVKIKSKRGKTPMAKAKKYKRHEIIEFLEQHNGR